MMRRRPASSAFVSCALLAALTGCSRADPPAGSEASASLVIDRVHDLVSLLSGAERSRENSSVALMGAAIEATDGRADLAYIRNPTGESITFSGLETRGPAILRFACGVGYRGDAIGPEPVDFRIEARDESREHPRWTKLFDERIDPAGLPRQSLAIPYEVRLPERSQARWSLRLSTERAGGDDPPLSWPGWLSPQLVSDGRRVERAEHPVRVRERVRALVDEFDATHVLRQRDDDPVTLAILDAAEDGNEAGGEKLSLRMAATARVRYQVAVPPRARLELEYGVDTRAGWMLPGDGMVFAVDIDGERVWRDRLDAYRQRRFRGWKLDVLDLEPWAGRVVTLDLATDTGPDDQNDVGGFAVATLVGERDVQRLLASEAPTVIVILVDTLRADRLGAYGNAGGLTPTLDRLAADGVVYRAARSSASWTLPATVSLLTGMSPVEHGVLDGRRSTLVDAIETLPERFQSRGYTTGAFVTNPLIGPVSNLTRGFETFVSVPFVGAQALFERASAWIDDSLGAAHMLFVHAIDPHAPYAPEADETRALDLSGSDPTALWLDMLSRGAFDEDGLQTWRATVEPKYDADVRAFDTALGHFLDGLAERGVLDDAIVAVVADHGEEFFEHGQRGHGGQLYDETLAVPLVVTGFGRSRLEPAVVEEPVEARGLLATLCEAARIPVPDDDRISPPLRSETRGAPMFGMTTHGYEPGVEGWTDKLSVVAGGFKLIFTPASERVELYDLSSDAAELHDLSETRPEIVEALRKTLEAWWASSRAGGADEPESQAAREALEALGYLER
ncbi:MAG: sulfatase [Planctomycetes bacterium]|nr:sulfatase [Planctomycetota bacterium]